MSKGWHRDDSGNRRCNGCERIVRLCICLEDILGNDRVCVIGVVPETLELRVLCGGAMAWDVACDLRNFLVNQGDCRVWIEGFLHWSGEWRYRITMRDPSGDADDRCGGVS